MSYILAEEAARAILSRTYSVMKEDQYEQEGFSTDLSDGRMVRKN